MEKAKNIPPNTLSKIYFDAAKEIVKVADGVFRHTPAEHMLGTMALSCNMWGTFFAKHNL